MNRIEMLPVKRLKHHPDNPRKEFGDLTELTESIRANGVMQNLTVVFEEDPPSGMYLVVIGNRRLEAAKAAGLEELPCVVAADMDHKTQVATMLMENMQREDLTVYEQAQGFQMMMKLGFSQKEIGEKTGFSETTVKRRLKMAELDRKTFQKAVAMQITMEELDMIGQLEDVKQRNELLKEYGESNFNWKLNRALKVQKASKHRDKAHQMLQEAGVKKIPDKDKYSMYGGAYKALYSDTCELDKWDGKKRFIPKPKEDGELYYIEDGTDIKFYLKEKKKKAEPVKKSAEELAEEKKISLAWKTAERITKASWEIRRAYAQKMKVSPKNAMEMLQWALIASMVMAFSYDTPTNTIRNDETIPVDGYTIPELIDKVHKWVSGAPQSKWAEIILMMFEGENRGKNGYADGPRYALPKHKENKKLDLCYEWLTKFGYQMSDEEIQMMSGTHPCFQGKAEEEQE